MIYSNVDFNVVYVDPSIETPGDGTTPAGALKVRALARLAMEQRPPEH